MSVRAAPASTRRAAATSAHAQRPDSVVVVYAPREHTRTRIRATLVRVHRRGVLARTERDFASAFRAHFVDTALVEVTADDDGHGPAELAREYPSIPFLGLTPFRPVDAPAIARCAELDFADVLADGTDDGVLGHSSSHTDFRYASRPRSTRPPSHSHSTQRSSARPGAQSSPTRGSPSARQRSRGRWVSRASI